MILDFEKWHGCNNDFIVVCFDQKDDIYLQSLTRQAAKICARDGSGIGADGILALQYTTDPLNPEFLTIVNSDGSLARTCGNGLRCAAGFILKRHLDDGASIDDITEGIELDLDGDKVFCRFLDQKKMNNPAQIPLIAIDMGIPEINEQVNWHQDAVSIGQRYWQQLDKPSQLHEIGSCKILNEHIVFYCDDAKETAIKQLGPQFQKEKNWHGINVHIAAAFELSDKERAQAHQQLGSTVTEAFTAQVWERGAGQTQACGSGACAIVCSALAGGLLTRDQWVAVDMPGGRLYVMQKEAGEAALLAGPTVHVFSGQLDF